MSTGTSSTSTTPAAPAAAPAAATTTQPKKQPSLYARKLLQKFSTLHPNASLESRQTIASWMIFNRKKVEGMGEGLLLAIEEASSGASGKEEDAAARLVLLLRILHQVFTSDSPTIGAAEEAGDADKWAKSSPLRCRLGEIVLLPLWKALASCLRPLNEKDAPKEEQYQNEIKGMIDEWKEHDVFGGPTIWEEYRRGWTRAWKEAAVEVVEDAAGVAKEEGAKPPSNDEDAAENATTTKNEQPLVAKEDAKEETSPKVEKLSNISKGGDEHVKNENENKDSTNENQEVTEDKPSDEIPPVAEEGGEGKAPRRESKRDSIVSLDVEVDFEGVEESKVEPSQFLDACKVIASIQITRDLGSDSAMNLSSTLSKIPSEVEEACNTILTKQQSNDNETTTTTTAAPAITDLLPVESLSNLPDDVLNLDLKYARHSIQTYREAVRRQRKARLQCLHLLLRSRCSFGSMEAARAFCGASGKRKKDGSDADDNGGDGDDAMGENNINMDEILDKLKKRKEILVDAMALEGLDVEEDEEEKKMEKEEEALKPLDWFLKEEEEDEKGKEEGPATKKIKNS
eukprot:CAMPEP_0183719210 /NCGR_PEP_ID=MMETSP0737-20130205/12257_1 /TAXON_ID=385413 /ORGANISM="Thalassiosira miniscula, Strain CCMP1093" /LENGTH=570 /DNA_ID=CAMNT_0025948921 /DNA_START=39 /DNA_END=1751 /DNA_ORIENTATION=+